MNNISEVIESLKVSKGDTVFLRMCENLSVTQIEEIRKGFDKAELECRVVFLPPDIYFSSEP